MLLLLVSTAFAQDTKYVSEGNATTVQGPVFVVPEVRMDELLAKAKSADELLVKTQECVDAATPALVKAEEAFGIITARMDTDAQLIRDLQAKDVVSQDKIRRAKNQRNLALIAASSVVAGVITAAMVSK